MPEALISSTTSRGPGVGSGNSRSSSFRSPRNTTPFMHDSCCRWYCCPLPRRSRRSWGLPDDPGRERNLHHEGPPRDKVSGLAETAGGQPHLLLVVEGHPPTHDL